MTNCSMVVGPKFHFTKLNPTGNFKYFRGNLYDLLLKQTSLLPLIQIPYIIQNKAPSQKTALFLLDCWTGLKHCNSFSCFSQCASTRFLIICILCNHS